MWTFGGVPRAPELTGMVQNVQIQAAGGGNRSAKALHAGAARSIRARVVSICLSVAVYTVQLRTVSATGPRNINRLNSQKSFFEVLPGFLEVS